MFAIATQAPSPIIVTDYRNKADDDRDTAYGGLHVLHDWHVGRAALGGLRYLNQTTRWALFNAGQKPTERQRNQARNALLKRLREATPTRVYVIPNETGTQQKLPPSLCWQALGAPDSAGNMRGTCWPWEQHTVTPLYPNSPVLKLLQQVQQTHWLRRWREPTLRCAAKYTVPDEHMFRALVAMSGASHVALDIETMTTGNLITAIGLSDGRSAVSLPYDTYRPYQHEEDEPGYRAYGDMGKACRDAVGQILAAAQPKVLHNYTFDIPRLAAEGFAVNGQVHCTFAAHSIAFPELQHGLQHACAGMLNVPPWKSVYHPKLKNITRDDEEFWIADPVALRDYNCDDAFYTWHLGHVLLPAVEVTL